MDCAVCVLIASLVILVETAAFEASDEAEVGQYVTNVDSAAVTVVRPVVTESSLQLLSEHEVEIITVVSISASVASEFVELSLNGQ